MKNKIKNLLHNIKANSNSLIIYICCLIIGVFFTYLLFQVEIETSLWLVISNISEFQLLFFTIGASFIFILNELKKFKQELFDKIEREHRITISYLQSKLTEEINYSVKTIILQEK